MKQRLRTQSPTSQAAFSVIGLGCLLAFFLVLLLGRLSFLDFDLAFANQVPLTISGDAGCLVGLAIVALAGAAGVRGAAAEGYASAFVSAGLCVSALARSGILVGSTSASLVAGDFLTGVFGTLCSYLWWRVYARWDEGAAVSRLAVALALAAALFLVLALMPQAVSLPLSCVALPLGMCLCFFPLLSTGEAKSPEANGVPGKAQPSDAETPQRVQPEEMAKGTASQANRQRKRQFMVVLVTVSLSCFVVDLGMDLFPICLYHESSPALSALFGMSESTNAPLGTLTQPAAICALTVMLLAGALYGIARKRMVPLICLYATGFALTAFDYLAFPYHIVGGLPLGLAEAGRITIGVFVCVVLFRMLKNRAESREATRLFLIIGATALAAMLVADAIAAAVQIQPGFDYADFQFRTVFAGLGTAFLISLILGPLPKLDEATCPVSSPAESASGNPSESDSNAQVEVSLDERFGQACASFAADHGLSAREGEVFSLIANGRDVPYIERELVLAKSTVKTHIKHIYEKCGVTSRQSLLDMFEEYRG